jgi:hypothetical protein
MASARDFEGTILGIVTRMITDWLAQVRAAIFGRGRLYPDPSAVQNAAPAWADLIDSQLMPALEEVAAAGWEDTSGRGYISTNGFVLAQLAMTRNLLVRMPDEVYNLIFEQITIGQTNGETREQIADRIDSVLFWTGSEYWPNRAKVISVTETHRAWQAGVLAASQYYESATGPGWTKTWVAEKDDHTRPCHRRADGQKRRLRDTFQICGEDLMYPGDPAGGAANVINCRCDMHITEAS